MCMCMHMSSTRALRAESMLTHGPTCTHQTIAVMAKDPAVSSIEVDCLQHLDMSLPESDDFSPGDHDMDQVEAVARRLSVQTRAPWGLDRIDTNGEPAVRSWRHPQLPTAAQRASRACDGAPIVFPALTPSSLALPTGGGIDRKYDDGDLTGEGVRVYIVDTGVLGSHTQFGDRVVDGHTVRVVPVAARIRPSPTTRPPQL